VDVAAEHAYRRPERASRWAAGRYALAWLAAVALAAAAAIGLSGTAAPPHHSPTGGAGALTAAARQGGCVLRQETGRISRRDLDVMQPPTFGPSGPPAAPGVYRRSPAPTALVGALRRGAVVVQYRAGAGSRTVRRVRGAVVLAAVRSIVTPDRTGMRYAVAATAWGRLLGCPRVSDSALLAIQTFVARYGAGTPMRRR
jgi:hypothetical protein